LVGVIGHAVPGEVDSDIEMPLVPSLVIERRDDAVKQIFGVIDQRNLIALACQLLIFSPSTECSYIQIFHGASIVISSTSKQEKRMKELLFRRILSES
jgi:hypothetical protein